MASSEHRNSIEGVSGEVITTISRKQGGREICFAAASEDETIRPDLDEAEAGQVRPEQPVVSTVYRPLDHRSRSRLSSPHDYCPTQGYSGR